MLLLLLFWLYHVTCGILVPDQGLKPWSWQWKCQVLTTGPPGLFLIWFVVFNSCCFLILGLLRLKKSLNDYWILLNACVVLKISFKILWIIPMYFPMLNSLHCWDKSCLLILSRTWFVNYKKRSWHVIGTLYFWLIVHWTVCLW